MHISLADCALRGFIIALLTYMPIFVMWVFSEDNAHGPHFKRSLLSVAMIWIGAILILYAAHN